MRLRGINKTYDIVDTPFANGGEGSVHYIKAQNDIVAKIYKKDGRTLFKKNKLEAMQKCANQFKHSNIAWPIDILYDSSGFVGFVMRKFANTIPISYAFTKKKYTFNEKLNFAIKLVETIAIIHNSGQCVGDLSDANIGICNGNIFLYDADSFQYTDLINRSIYRCCVFTDNYIAPEVYNQVSKESINRMRNTPYSIESDLFVLAIHIFKLLTGCHPFACASTNPQTNIPSLNENIKNGFSPFFKDKANITIPLYSADPHFLPKEIQYLFYKTFVLGHSIPKNRTTTKEWLLALNNLSRMQTKTCKKDSTHIYLKENRSCPWCEAEHRVKSISIVRQTNVTVGNNATGSKKKSVKHTSHFWEITLLVAVIIQSIPWLLNAISIYYGYDFRIPNEDYVWVMILNMAGIIGPIIYNINSQKEKVLNYVLSILISPVSSALVVVGAIAAMFLGAICLAVLVVVFIISIIANS